jgi:hypothetical protein
MLVMLEQFGCVAPVLVHEEKLQGLLLADHLAVREYEGPPQPRNMPENFLTQHPHCMTRPWK